MESQIESGSMSFALEVYRRLKRDQQNLVVSPFSLSAALSMALMGCRGKTAEELSQTLFSQVIPEKEFESLAKQFNVLVGGAVKANEKVLSVANFMYQQRSFGIVPDFKKILENNFAARAVEVDFKNHRKEAVDTINKDISLATRHNVKQLLQEDDVDGDTRLILVNAVYFKGLWQVPFSPEDTNKCPFTLSSGEQVQVMMMSDNQMDLKERFYCPYNAQLKCQALKLPFADTNTSMILLLPCQSNIGKIERAFLKSLELQLTAPILDQLIKSLTSRMEVFVQLPKFKLEAQHNLIPVLKQLGINELFSHSADLSGVSETNQPFSVSQIIQKAVIEVNEEGAEAAAASDYVETYIAAGEKFIANRPFMFLLVSEHQDTNTILFMGAVEDPRN